MLSGMQVTLTPHAEELLREQLARRSGQTPEQILERALEKLTLAEPELTEEELERRRQAVDRMREFRRKHHLTLDRGDQGLREFLHEGHRY